MANRLKKKTTKPPSAEKLNPDKEAEVSVQEVIKDERTAKITGAVSLLFAAFLFIAFVSYFFTYSCMRNVSYYLCGNSVIFVAERMLWQIV